MVSLCDSHQVDETWNVKLADFGLARVKDYSGYMTRCGTPQWTGTHKYQLNREKKLNELTCFFWVSQSARDLER